MSGFHLFTLANIPVRVSPWYIILLAIFAQNRSAADGMLFGLCATVSLLVHELGHAFVARHYKLNPQVLLHGMGGLTGHDRPQSNGADALIVAAGPLAGLTLCAVSFVALRSLNVPSPALQSILETLFEINLFWSIFNLLPMWPMDGGQLLRLGAAKLFKPGLGARVTHVVSIGVVLLVGLGAYNYLRIGPMMLMILALMAWQNVQALQMGTVADQAPRADNPLARELLGQAETAYQAGDDEQAERLGHQLRSLPNVPPQLLARCWAILGVTSTRAGRYEEALSYLRRAPDMSDVVEATAQCFYQLGMFDALEALAGTNAFARLPADTRETILAALRDSPSTGPA
jgi:stage IV sporulation protein FB